MAEAEAQVVEEENVEVTIDESAGKEPVQQDLELDDKPKVAVKEESEGDELDNYSKGVQKRIKKLTEK